MDALCLGIHITTCILLVIGILLQASKGGGFSGIFGSSGEVIFSTPSSSSFLRKATWGLALMFGLTSVTLTMLTKARMFHSVVLEQPAGPPPTGPAPQTQQQPAPAQPQQPAQQK